MRRSIIFLIGLVILCMTGQPIVAQRSIVPVQEVDMLFAGDIMQHVGQLNMARLPNGRYSYSYYYRHIKDFIKKADISVANLETPIGKKDFSGYPMFCAPDSFLYAIKDAGFNVLLFANNHCCDKGKSGAMHTLNMLDSLGFAHCGVYRNAQERAERYPLVVEKEGMRIAILNYTYGTNGMPVPKPMVVNLIDKKVIAEDIAEAKRKNVDAIIACMHWGDEYVSLPPKRVKELSDWLLEQGVDHIIGNHPHVLQPIEVRESTTSPDKHVVVYSIGNLVSNMATRRTDGGIMVTMKLQKTFSYTRHTDLGYMFAWITPRENNGKRDYTIYPAATTVIKGNARAEEKRKLFLNDSRKLFKTHNKGEMTEIMLDTVRITR